MNKFTVRVYKPTLWSFFTQADEYDDYEFSGGEETLEDLALRLAKTGFRTRGKWIMPGAILEIIPHKDNKDKE